MSAQSVYEFDERTFDFHTKYRSVQGLYRCTAQRLDALKWTPTSNDSRSKKAPPHPYVDSFFFHLKKQFGNNPKALRAKLTL
jgi:hypothetical protein